MHKTFGKIPLKLSLPTSFTSPFYFSRALCSSAPLHNHCFFSSSSLISSLFLSFPFHSIPFLSIPFLFAYSEQQIERMVCLQMAGWEYAWTVNTVSIALTHRWRSVVMYVNVYVFVVLYVLIWFSLESLLSTFIIMCVGLAWCVGSAIALVHWQEKKMKKSTEKVERMNRNDGVALKKWKKTT